MNKIYLILALVVMVSAFASCDEVEFPVVEQPDLDFSLYPDPDISTYPWPVWTSNTNTEINVLFEDYTGHKCLPCWQASQDAEALEEANPEHVFLVSIHASPTGLFQETSADYPIDYTTEAGDEYSVEMQGFIGNPQGTTNRLTFGVEQQTWLPSAEWSNGINAALSEDLKVNVQVQYNYYPSTNGLFVHVETEFLEGLEGQYNLVNYLIRKKVVSPQTTPFGTNPEHEHHNVMSEVIGPTWGVNLSTGTAAAGDLFYSDFSYALPDPAVDSTYVSDNLAVFTYVHNRATYEVMQVIRTDIQ